MSKPLILTGLLPEHILRMIDFAERKKLGKAFRTFEEIQVAAAHYTERKLHEQIRTLLNLKGIVYFESRMDRRTTQRKGTPDFLFAILTLPRNKNAVAGLPERLATPCAWEAKVGKSKLRPEQEELHRRMRKNGWTVEVIRSQQEAADKLKEMGI